MQTRNFTFQSGSRETQGGQPASPRAPRRSGAEERLNSGAENAGTRALILRGGLGKDWEQGQGKKAT